MMPDQLTRAYRVLRTLSERETDRACLAHINEALGLLSKAMHMMLFPPVDPSKPRNQLSVSILGDRLPGHLKA